MSLLQFWWISVIMTIIQGLPDEYKVWVPATTVLVWYFGEWQKDKEKQ